VRCSNISGIVTRKNAGIYKTQKFCKLKIFTDMKWASSCIGLNTSSLIWRPYNSCF